MTTREDLATRKLIRRLNQLMRNPWLESRVPRILHNAQISLWPCAMQIPRTTHRAHHVVATLHDHRRNPANAIDVSQQLIIVFEKAAIDEVVAFDTRKR